MLFSQFANSYEIKDQTFSDSNGTYSVLKLVKFAQKNKKVENLQIKSLLHELQNRKYEEESEIPGSMEFVERADKADLKYPIIVVKYPNKLVIADGLHRLWKANELKHKTIKAYIIDQKDLNRITN